MCFHIQKTIIQGQDIRIRRWIEKATAELTLLIRILCIKKDCCDLVSNLSSPLTLIPMQLHLVEQHFHRMHVASTNNAGLSE